jgi:hypothetical protein
MDIRAYVAGWKVVELTPAIRTNKSKTGKDGETLYPKTDAVKMTIPMKVSFFHPNLSTKYPEANCRTLVIVATDPIKPRSVKES